MSQESPQETEQPSPIRPRGARPPQPSAPSTGEMFEDLRNRPDQLIPLVILMGLVLIVLWSYWNTLTWVAGFWEDPLYSHGWLVPLFTLVLLWIRGKPVDPVTLGASWFIGLTFFVVGLGMRLAAWQYGMETLGTISWAFAIPGLFLLVLIFMFRRDQFEPATMDGRWCGLALIGASLGLRLLATHYSMETIDSYSLVPAIAGVFLLVGGWQLIRWAGPPILFLVFMFPLPSVLKTSILGRLQGWATGASTYALQTLGIAAIRDGNRISIGDLELGVVDACAGLRMTTIFFALAVAIALVAKRPWWDRLIILISAIPIALTVNIVRVTVTGMLYMTAGDSELAHKIFHDWAGWFMMPLALGLLYVELQILSHLVIEDEEFPAMAVRRPATIPRPQA